MSARRSFFETLTLCLTSRCPVCAKGYLFTPLSRIRSFGDLCMPPDTCEACGFQFRRESGYYFGVLTPLLPILALTTGLLFVAVYFLWCHPSNPLDLLWPGGIGTGVGFVFGFRPAIAIFICLDHSLDPPA